MIFTDLSAECLCCWFRTAARATLALFPLFGLTGILFTVEPKASVTILAYRIVNAVLQSSQVSLLPDYIYILWSK